MLGALAVASALVPPVVVNPDSRGRQGDRADVVVASRWDYAIRLDLPSGWAVDSRGIDLGGQYATVSTSAQPNPLGRPCLVQVSQGDRTDLSASLVDSQPVVVHEHRAYAGAYHRAPGSPLKELPRVVWEYAAGAWATASCDTADPVGDATTMARSVTVVPATLAVPFTLGALPAGLRPTEITHQTRPGGPDRVLLQLVAGSLGDGSPRRTPDDRQATATIVFAPTTDERDRADRIGSRPIAEKFGGHTAWLNPTTGTLGITAGSHTLYLSAAGLGDDGAERIARTLTLAEPLEDASTWYELSHALG